MQLRHQPGYAFLRWLVLFVLGYVSSSPAWSSLTLSGCCITILAKEAYKRQPIYAVKGNAVQLAGKTPRSGNPCGCPSSCTPSGSC